MWPGLVQTAKEGGIDVIETYVFWNGHELSPGNVSRKKLLLHKMHTPRFMSKYFVRYNVAN